MRRKTLIQKVNQARSLWSRTIREREKAGRGTERETQLREREKRLLDVGDKYAKKILKSEAYRAKRRAQGLSAG